jgi:hypothetical protein
MVKYADVNHIQCIGGQENENAESKIGHRVANLTFLCLLRVCKALLPVSPRSKNDDINAEGSKRASWSEWKATPAIAAINATRRK